MKKIIALINPKRIFVLILTGVALICLALFIRETSLGQILFLAEQVVGGTGVTLVLCGLCALIIIIIKKLPNTNMVKRIMSNDKTGPIMLAVGAIMLLCTMGLIPAGAILGKIFAIIGSILIFTGFVLWYKNTHQSN